MNVEFNKWLMKFLGQRGLNEPDGRPLFSYKCKTEEFNELKNLLSNIAEPIKNSNVLEKLHLIYPGIERSFVLYCAEWWRRNYADGPWKWQPIFESLAWPNFDFKNRSNLVERGIRYWKRALLRPARDREYLLTVACEGGLPVNLIQKDYNYLRSFLNAILNDVVTYSSSGIDANEIAEIHKDYLPQSLQQPVLIELSGMLISTIWELQSKITQSVDPVGELDRVIPSWRNKLPLSLEDETANMLVIVLLQQAKKLRSNASCRLAIKRKLIKIDKNWQLQAELTLPETIDCEFLKRELAIENSPGDRLELYLSWGEKIVRVSSLMKQGEVYNVYPYDRNQLQIRENAETEIRCSVFDSGRQIGFLQVPGGSILNQELPLIFETSEGDEQNLYFIGQGSVSSSLPQLFMLTNAKSRIDIAKEDKNRIELVSDQIKVFKCEMALFKLTGELKIALDEAMTCIVRTNQLEESKVEYRLEGRQSNLIETKYPAFFGIPQLKQIRDNGYIKKVSDSELLWSKVNGKRHWHHLTESPARGLIELRHVQNKECLFTCKIIIFPEKAEIRLIPEANENQRAIELINFETSLISCKENPDFKFSTTIEDKTILLNFISAKAIPGKIFLNIAWSNGCHCEFGLPFPREGARFLASDGSVLGSSSSLTLDNLYGSSAISISLHGGHRYYIKGNLKARDIDNKIQNLVSFETPLKEIAGNINVHEVPLFQLQDRLKSLFSQSTDPDAIVRLNLYRNRNIEAQLDIRQYSAKAKFDIESRQLYFDTMQNDFDNEFKKQSFELLPLFDPEAESYFVYPENNLTTFHNLLDYIITKGNWLAVASKNTRRYRPCLIQKNIQNNSIISDSILVDIISEADYDTRISLFQDLFQEMSNDLNHDQWPFYIKYIRRFAKVHPNCLDWIKVSIEYPRILIGLLLIGGPKIFEIVYEWEDHFPFKWWMLPLKDWDYAIQNYLRPFEQDEQTYQILLKDIFRILQRIAERNVSFIVALEFLQKKYNMNSATNCLDDVRNLGIDKSWIQIERCFRQNIFREKADDKWPVGIDRDEWSKLMASEHQNSLRWLKHNHGYQKPVLDAPLAAAYFTVVGIYPKQIHRVCLSILREFQSDWFDDVFRAVQAILLTELAMESINER